MAKNISKRDYRCHAHTNPFRDTNLDIPDSPNSIDWNNHFVNGRAPTFIDIGCGYGKFLKKTAKMFPEENVLGLEIRDKVFDYTRQMVDSVDNCSVIKTNALLFMPNYFEKDSLKKIFVLFADPHFKKRKQKGRIICKQTMQIFKHLLQVNGELYISTDVKELFDDMSKIIDESKCFTMQKEPENIELFEMCYKETDEAGRAGVKSGHTFGRVYTVQK